MTPFTSAEVAQVFASYPARLRGKLLALRELIFATAATTEGVGELEETLKWGEPAYITTSKTGSPVRIAWKARSPQQYAMYFNCQTDLVETFRAWFPHELRFEGNRAIVFDVSAALPRASVRACIASAMTYHRNKRRPRDSARRAARR